MSCQHHPASQRVARRRPLAAAGLMFLAAALLAGPGCAPGPRMLPPAERITIDRAIVEYPSGYAFQPYIQNLTGPTAIAFDDKGNLLIAEGGLDGRPPAIYGFKPDGEVFNIYRDPRLPFAIGAPDYKLFGPIGGMIWHDGKLYVSHRDKNGLGVITAMGYDGSRKTIIANMPTRGDHALTDLAISTNGRLYFGIGTATNSGIVGLDNWAAGWVRQYPKVHDKPFTKIRTRGVRMDSRNPQAGLFGPGEKAVTGPFQPFDVANKSFVYPPQDGKFNGAIYSVALDGGDLRAEAWGIRLPRGLAFNHLGSLYFTNNGMELRGTRPVKDDPDVLCRLVPGTWYGWPDYSADFIEITQPRFQPSLELLLDTGYDALPLLIDQNASGGDGVTLLPPSRATLLRGVFPSQAGAAKLVMVPRTGPFERFHGSAIVALSGDRAPFATSNQKTIGPIGYKVQRVIVDNQQVEDFIRNTRGVPAHLLDKRTRRIALERPADVKLGPDGYLYVLDMGRMEVKNGKVRTFGRTGKIFRLLPTEVPPAEQPAGETSGDGGDAPSIPPSDPE